MFYQESVLPKGVRVIMEAKPHVRQESARMVSEGISADELERARSYAVGQLIMSMEATHARMARLGRWAVEGVEMKSLDENESLLLRHHLTHYDICNNESLCPLSKK